ncbi:MAG: helix-turn-helix domain-containing protein [Candidatus Anammoxibacter sp.]
MISAEKVYKEILDMPVKEREKLFTVIARKGFEKEFYSHAEVFDEIRQSPFTIKETAEYFEVAEITVRRWFNSGKLTGKRFGRNILFDVDELKKTKKYLKAKRRLN